jgi:molybdate transport system regulatory protein
MEIRHKIWLERDGKVIFGAGRYELFRAIDESRSLNASAKKLNMSYRAAWGRVKASEERLGIKLVERARGKGMYLTAEGLSLLEQFDRLEQKTETFLEDASRNLSVPLRKKAKNRSVEKHADQSEQRS